jgi:hypothetical protein
MPLIECPDCKKQISDQAPACIHCGHPMHSAKLVVTAQDNSNIQRFTGYLTDNSDALKFKIFFGDDQESTVAGLLAKIPDGLSARTMRSSFHRQPLESTVALHVKPNLRAARKKSAAQF